MSSSPDYATTKSPDREESPRRRSPSRSRSPPRRRERSYSPSRSSSDRKPNRLFIGNLPKGQDAPSDRDISDLFSKYGKILSTTAKEGFAFVEFENEDDMKEAMEREDGATFRRYQIRVQLSHASSGDGRSRRQPGQGKCFNCQGFGHWARDCTEKRRDDRDRRGGYGGRDNYRNDRGGDRGGYRDRGDRGGDRSGDRSDDRGDRSDRRGGYGRDYGDNNGYGGPARREREDRAGSGPYTRSP